MSIPQNITYEHIIQAIHEIDKVGYSEKNKSKKFDLIFNEKPFPPKVVISTANKYANGQPLDFSEFSGGEEFANKYLREKGFQIERKITDDTNFEYESYSWKIISNQIATKKMDKSSFLHHGTGIPVEIRSFFGIESMTVGKKINVILTQGIIDFNAHIEVVNEDNPRTRLMWKTDLQREIQNKFPFWFEYFQTHTKHDDTTPILKFMKTPIENKYLIFFEDIKKSSKSLELMKVYSREELKNQFQITDATIKNGIYKPKDSSSIWLFITVQKTPDRTQYHDYFDGQTLQFEGQTKGRTDNLIINHEADQNEIIVFYRKKKREFPNYGFKYLGQFFYYSHAPGNKIDVSTRFILYPLDVMPDDDKGEMIPVESEIKPLIEGKERTSIQTRAERNPRLRKKAIEYHGTRCAVCNFSFSEKYGKYGEGYIEIHHLKPHSSFKGERSVDPIAELVPVCSNCHRMIHRVDPILSIEDLKKFIQNK